MGRGSGSTSTKNDSATTAGLVRKHGAGTWEAPKAPKMVASLDDELLLLENDIKNRIEIQNMIADNHIAKIKDDVALALTRFPKDVKNMNVRDCFEQYGGNLSDFRDHKKRQVMN